MTSATGENNLEDDRAARQSRRAPVGWLVRHSWLVLILWSVVISLVHIPVHGSSWHYFVTGAHAFVSPDLLSLYARHPELQMGPLTFLVVAPFVLVLHGVPGELGAIALMTAVGLLVVRELRVLSADRFSRGQWLLVSLIIMAVWTELSVHWAHVDDAMALLCSIIGLRLIRTGHPWAAAVLLALAVDFKPWAAPFVALLLLASPRRWVPLGIVWLATVAVAWVPFFLGDPGTLTALRFGISIDPASTLHLLGTPGNVTPSWDRYAQIFGAVVLAAIAVWRKRWAAVFLVVVAVRLLLDPGTKNYYDAGLVVGAGLFDLALSYSIVPLATIATFVLVYLPSYALADLPTVRGLLRSIVLLALLVAAFVWPRTSSGHEADRSTAPDGGGEISRRSSSPARRATASPS
jgi:hypothetical protein